MTQEQITYGVRIERRSAPRRVTTYALLCAGLAILEGAAAALVMLAPIFIGSDGASQPAFGIDLGHAALIAILYGTMAAQSASRFLETARYERSALSSSALSWTIAVAATLLLGFITGLIPDVPRSSLLWAYGLGLPALMVLRGIAYTAVSTRIRSGRLQYQKVAMVGTRADIDRFMSGANLWRNGYQLAGTFELDLEGAEANDARGAALVEAAQRFVMRGAEHVVLVGQLDDLDRLERLAEHLKRFAINVAVVPATDNTTLKFLDVVPLGANNALRVLRKPMGWAEAALKRLFDLSGAVIGLTLLSPFFVALAILIKLDSPGPVFYRQERRGFNGEIFRIWKFRSMRVLESGRQMTQARQGDERITRVGRVIRALSIDELPQLLNVLHGEMSLVGPRPHALVHDDALGAQLASYAHRQRIKPGITGWAQVNGFRGETTTYAQIEGRTRHDLYYIDNWSIFLDVWIIVLTIVSSKTHRNAF